MIGNHLVGERLNFALRLRRCKFARRDFKHIARSGFGEKIASLWRDAQAGVNAGLLSNRLGIRRNGGEGERCGREDEDFHGTLLVTWKYAPSAIVPLSSSCGAPPFPLPHL